MSMSINMNTDFFQKYWEEWMYERMKEFYYKYWQQPLTSFEHFCYFSTFTDAEDFIRDYRFYISLKSL